ncbi:ECF transporter S component [Scatolibacter rhodanostii]|uniref:ECF transporter S component n=1 Tax=Scatolibacter rhodanostii TaxID=2014781 RepID=UPI000C07CB70|nr:ECF transporter S component [Scatolibacter rhodanostii]
MQTMEKKDKIKQMAVLAMMTALSFLGPFINIPISIGFGNTMIHVGNAVCLVASLLIGGVWGGLAGGLGMALYDLTNPMFAMYSPFTFVQKFAMGFLCGKIAFGKAGTERSFKRNLLGTIVGVLANIFFAQLNALIVDSLIMGQNWMAVLTAGGAKLVVNLINAVLAVIISLILYPPVQKAMKQSKLWDK